MKSALLVIDAQKIYTNENSELYCKDSVNTIKKINRLIKHFQKNQQPIFLIKHIHKIDGSDLGRMFDFTGKPEENFNFKENSVEVEYDNKLNKPKESFEIIKTRYSAFIGTNLEEKLKELGVDTLVICGFMTNFCCESTARDAHDRDYFVDFIIDATGTPGTDNFNERKIRKIVSELLSSGFARIKTTKEYLNKREENV